MIHIKMWCHSQVWTQINLRLIFISQVSLAKVQSEISYKGTNN